MYLSGSVYLYVDFVAVKNQYENWALYAGQVKNSEIIIIAATNTFFYAWYIRQIITLA